MTREEMTKAMIEAVRDGVATISTIKYKEMHITMYGAENSVTLSIYPAGTVDNDVEEKILTPSKAVSEAIEKIDKAIAIQAAVREMTDNLQNEIVEKRKSIIANAD